jgi:L-alanine-DL-glutamate epimerase-like enolase superfamily enzyme
MGKLDIRQLRLVRLAGTLDPAWHWAREKDTAHPLHRFAEFRQRPEPAPQAPVPIAGCYVEVAATNGVGGRYGPVYEETALVVARRLRPLLLGRDVSDADETWDLMVRSDRHLQTGLGMMAVSAVDNALWDLRGRTAEKPVCRLLSGRVRESLPAYRTTNDYPYDPAEMAAFARAIVAEGYRYMKWYPRHAGGAGPAGIEIDTRMVRTLVEAVGRDATVMFDCFMGWDRAHARTMFPVLMQAQPMWIEEPFPPRCLDDFRAIHREFPDAPLATGEHLYTRWEVKPFLDEGLLAVVQCDPDWCGGITELQRICELAARYGVRVVPHGHTIAAAVHVIAAQSGDLCPLVEVLPRHQYRMQYFHREPVVAAGGAVACPGSPGLGMELDDSRVETREEVFA